MPNGYGLDVATAYLSLERGDGTIGRIAYDDCGRGPLAVLVPGIGVPRTSFRHLTPLLVDDGYRVITVDYRGLGESDTGWDEYSSAATARDLIALLHHAAGGPALLYCTSYAAAAAVHVAVDAPELLRGAVLVAPFVHDVAEPDPVARIVDRLTTVPRFTRRLWMSRFPRMYPRPPADYADFRDEVDDNLREPGRAAVLARMCASTHAPALTRLSEAAAGGIPFLVAMGTADAVFPDPPAEAQWIGQALSAPVRMIAGAGHHPHEDAPQRIALLIEQFDQGVPRTPAFARGQRAGAHSRAGRRPWPPDAAASARDRPQAGADGVRTD
ncbi:MAG TPA: alpha/beta hydrolase [Actinocrinis sp.]|uniref:alpha/beta fold hydrolase n=1 Tax=Actinocrinis sp. TaxID=1920516 RepID=UPI002DDD0F48|nr:alpha/beta hydrolase [Actinocrinis sp.]HEV2347698.1 alpha/beta hydrolase [Actinocrinis sp.]